MEQFLELVVNFQNDPMAVWIIGSAPLSLPLPHSYSLVQLPLVQLSLPQAARPRAIGAPDRDAAGRGSIRTGTAKKAAFGRPFP